MIGVEIGNLECSFWVPYIASGELYRDTARNGMNERQITSSAECIFLFDQRVSAPEEATGSQPLIGSVFGTKFAFSRRWFIHRIDPPKQFIDSHRTEVIYFDCAHTLFYVEGLVNLLL